MFRSSARAHRSWAIIYRVYYRNLTSLCVNSFAGTLARWDPLPWTETWDVAEFEESCVCVHLKRCKTSNLLDFRILFLNLFSITCQFAGGPSMYCVRWSNEAATVHADITADHRDVPASCFYCCGMGLSREPLSDTFISRFARLPQSGFFDVFFWTGKGKGQLSIQPFLRWLWRW